MHFNEREKEVLDVLEATNDIVNKSFHLRDGADDFTFFDGPPTANGKPAYRPCANPRHQGPDSPLSRP